MTRRDTLQCVHEPFGDAYYFGPERLAERYENDENSRLESGYSDSTYRTIFDRIARENSEVGPLPSAIDALFPSNSLFAFFLFNTRYVQSKLSLLHLLPIRRLLSSRVHLSPLPHGLTTVRGFIASDACDSTRQQKRIQDDCLRSRSHVSWHNINWTSHDLFLN